MVEIVELEVEEGGVSETEGESGGEESEGESIKSEEARDRRVSGV